MNELDVVVTLRLGQIQYIQSKIIPQDLSKCLVFDHGFLLGKLFVASTAIEQCPKIAMEQKISPDRRPAGLMGLEL